MPIFFHLLTKQKNYNSVLLKIGRTDDDIFDLDCSEVFIYNRNFSVHETMPSEKFYDEKCEDCFANEQ